MKRCICLLIILIAFSLFAIPQTIQYQGKLADLSGIGENDTLDIRFRIYDIETGGDSLWAITVADVPIVHGLFDVNIGPIDLPFDQQYWLEIVVDGNTLAPRVQLTSSPYAFRAAVADSFTGGVAPWTQDTMIAHWDSVRNKPDSLIEGIGVMNYIPKWLDDSTLGSSNIYNTVGHIGMQKDVNISYRLTVDTILAPIDTLYLPQKVWMDELVTDSIESRGDIVTIHDPLYLTDSLYFDGDWRKDWPVVPDRFVQLRANGGPWLTDSVTFVEGANITLTQTGDSIEIAATGSVGANGWVDDGTVVRLETATDNVGIGLETPAQKVHLRELSDDVAIAYQFGGSAESITRAPTVAVNDNSNGEVDTWTTPEECYESDDVWAYVRIGSDTTAYLKATNFGFSADVPIKGVEVLVEKHEMGAIGDAEVRLVKGGVVVGENRATSSEWPSSDATEVYGGSADLWGESWSLSDVNDPGFGVVISVRGVFNAYAFIDQIRITLYFEPPAHWSTGIDLSDSKSFKISNSLTPGTDDVLTLNTDGTSEFTSTVSGADAVNDDEFVTKGQLDASTGDVGWVDDGTVVRLETATDNVGIGTASPRAKLDVCGDFRVGNSTRFMYVEDTPVDSWFTPRAPCDVSESTTDCIDTFYTDTDLGAVVYDQYTFSVEGFHRSIPYNRIEVDYSYFVIDTTDGSGSFTGTVSGADAVDDDEFVTKGQVDGGDVGHWSDSGNDIYNTNSGNVGIGTSSPGAKLDVAGHIWQTGLGYSVFIGVDAGANDDLTYNSNVAIGYSALYRNTTGIWNTANGSYALYSNTTGDRNTAYGLQALYSNDSGHYNTAIGYNTLFGNQGNYNTALGYEAGDNIYTGSNNIIIGANVDAPSGTADDQLNIGNTIYGDLSTGCVGIGTTSPTAGLHIRNTSSEGIIIENTGDHGLYIDNTTYAAIYLNEPTGHGIEIWEPTAKAITITRPGGGCGIEVLQATYDGIGVFSSGDNGIEVSSSGDDGIYSSGNSDYEGYFNGDLFALSANASIKSFLIDHPSDPEHKLLRHYSIESPEVLLIYRGKVKLDSDGIGKVHMPEYFGILTNENEASANLTPVGRPFLTGADWENNNTTLVVYGEPNREVYYTVYAERDDPVKRYLYQPVESNKADGKYCPDGELLVPEAYGYPETMGRHYEMRHEAPCKQDEQHKE